MWMRNRLMQKVSQMHTVVRFGKMAFHGTLLMVAWSVMPLMLPTAYSQPKEPVPAQAASRRHRCECRVALRNFPARALSLAAVVSERAMTKQRQAYPVLSPAGREHKSEAAALYGDAGGGGRDGDTRDRAAPIIEHKRVRPSETYVAGFGGYTFGGKLSDVEGTGLLPGGNVGDRDLADSASLWRKDRPFLWRSHGLAGRGNGSVQYDASCGAARTDARSSFAGHDLGLQSHRAAEIRV